MQKINIDEVWNNVIAFELVNIQKKFRLNVFFHLLFHIIILSTSVWFFFPKLQSSYSEADLFLMILPNIIFLVFTLVMLDRHKCETKKFLNLILAPLNIQHQIDNIKAISLNDILLTEIFGADTGEVDDVFSGVHSNISFELAEVTLSKYVGKRYKNVLKFKGFMFVINNFFPVEEIMVSYDSRAFSALNSKQQVTLTPEMIEFVDFLKNLMPVDGLIFSKEKILIFQRTIKNFYEIPEYNITKEDYENLLNDFFTNISFLEELFKKYGNTIASENLEQINQSFETLKDKSLFKVFISFLLISWILFLPIYFACLFLGLMFDFDEFTFLHFWIIYFISALITIYLMKTFK